MALATQCPHCRTTFRVAHDQLKLRAGLVRCGSCKQIFNGIEHLLSSEAVAATRTLSPTESAEATRQTAAAPPVSPSQPAAQQTPKEIPPAAPVAASAELDFAYPDAEPDSIPDTVLENKPDEPIEVEFVEVQRKSPLPAAGPAEPAFSQPPAASPAAQEAPTPDPLQRMTLVDLSDEQDQQPEHADHVDAARVPEMDVPDQLDQVMEEFERKPARGKKKTRPHVRSPLVTMQEEIPPAAEEVPPPTQAESLSEAEEPEFVKRERKKQTRGRSMRIAMSAGAFLLFLTALMQAGYALRDQLAARIPESKPLLQSACTYLGCKISLPAQIDNISIESHQIVTLATRKDTSELSLLLRNSGSTVQAWPQLEMTLIDENNIPLARRVFSPAEYLPASTDPQKGFAATSEQQVKVYFEFIDAKPANYHVDVFYR